MDSLCVVISIMATRVCGLSTSHGLLVLTLAGYTKEQSLKGIAEWFDFWLSSEASQASKL